MTMISLRSLFKRYGRFMLGLAIGLLLWFVVDNAFGQPPALW